MPIGDPDSIYKTGVKVLSQKLTKVHTDILALGFFQDIRPLIGYSGEIDWIQNGILSCLILQDKIRGVLSEATLLPAQRKLPAPKILIMGLGVSTQFSERSLGEIYSRIYQILGQLHVKNGTTELFGRSEGIQEITRAAEVLLREQRRESARGIEMSVLVPNEERARQIQQVLQQRMGAA